MTLTVVMLQNLTVQNIVVKWRKYLFYHIMFVPFSQMTTCLCLDLNRSITVSKVMYRFFSYHGCLKS